MATADQLPAFLGSIPLLRGLPAEDIARLARRAPAPRLYAPDPRDGRSAAIYDEGASSGALYIVLDAGFAGGGSTGDTARPVVQVSVEDDKLTTRVRLWRVYTRDYFGEFELLGGSEAGRFPVRLSKAVALTPSPILEIPFKLLDAFIDDHPIVFRRLAREAIARFQQTLEDTLAGKVSDPDVALANWIVERARDFGIKEGNHVRFRRAFPQEDIGRDLGVSRETISLRLNEWRRRGLMGSARGQQFVVRDMDRVERIAALALERSRDEHTTAVDTVDAALGRGDNFRARNFALDVLSYFPGSAELKHRAALAVARCGATREALSLLERFGFAGDANTQALEHLVRSGIADPASAPKAQRDAFDRDDLDERLAELGDTGKVAVLTEDILALAPRLWKDLAFQHKSLDKQAAHKAFEGYNQAFAASARPYTGVNAASLAFVLGKPADGRKLAQQVIAKLPKKPSAYWDLAAAGEAHLLLGEPARAKESFEAALVCADAFEGSVAATRLQLTRLAAAKIAGAAELLGVLPNHAVVVIGAPPVRGASRAPDASALEAAARKNLRDHRVGHVYGAPATEAEIVIAEAALAEGAQLHIVLPLPVDDFLAAAALPADPPAAAGKDAARSWRERFEQCLAKAASLTILPIRLPPARETEAAFRHAHRHAAGAALLKADALLAPCLTLAADGSAEGVTAHLLTPNKPPEDHPADATWRPVVFAWLLAESGDAPLSAKGIAAEAIGEIETIVQANVEPGTFVLRRVLAGNRPQTALVAIPADIGTAIATAQRLLSASWPGGITVQLALDLGPVLGSQGKPNEDRLKDLDIGSGPLEVPERTLVASAAFAMEARLALGEALSIVALGRVARLESGAGGVQLLPSAEIYALDART
jgi:CRP-like cAMP-binding protein/tetratricopeptide (TPR) repeat protein